MHPGGGVGGPVAEHHGAPRPRPHRAAALRQRPLPGALYLLYDYTDHEHTFDACTYLGSTCLEVRLSVWWHRNNVSLPLPPPRRVCKMFGSIFAAEPRALLAHPLAFWQRLLATHAWAAPCYQLENMWQPLLVAADSRRRPRQRDTGG